MLVGYACVSTQDQNLEYSHDSGSSRGTGMVRADDRPEPRGLKPFNVPFGDG